MDKKELANYKNILMGIRNKILKELGQLKDGEMSSTLKDASGENSAYSFHVADVGTDNRERETAFFFATEEGRFLYHID